MNLSVPLPDEFAQRVGAGGETIERRILEALALDEFRIGRPTRPELKRLLGFATRGELDAFLVSHGICGRYSARDLDRDRADLKRLGF